MALEPRRPVVSDILDIEDGLDQAIRSEVTDLISTKSPVAIPSLLRYFSPDEITGVANQGAVQTLPDLSTANSPATQATVANRPLLLLAAFNGKNGIRYDGVNHFMSFTRQTEVRTIIVAMRFNEPQATAATLVSLLGDTSTFDLITPDPNTSPALINRTNIGPSKTRAEVWINGVYTSDLYSAVRHSGFALYAIRMPEGQSIALSQIAQDRGTVARRTSGVYGDIALFSSRLDDINFESVQKFFLKKYAIQRGTKPYSPALFHGLHAGDSISIARGGVPAFITQTLTNFGGPTRAFAQPIGVSGSTVREWAAQLFGSQLFRADVPGLTNSAIPQLLFFFCGTNDLRNSWLGEDVYRDLRYVWAQARSYGFKVIAFTVMSRGEAGLNVVNFNTQRKILNDLIRSDSTLYDALGDIAASEYMGYDGAHTDTNYFGDLIHPTVLGAQIIGNIAHQAVLTLPEFGGRYRKYRIGNLSAAGSVTLPAGALLDTLTVRNLTTNAVTGGLKIGTTVGGADIIAAQALGASAQVEVTSSGFLKRQLSRSLLNPIYVDAVTSWNGAIVDLEVFVRI